MKESRQEDYDLTEEVEQFKNFCERNMRWTKKKAREERL